MPERANILSEFLSAIEGLVERPQRTPRQPMRAPPAETGPDLEAARRLAGPVRASQAGEEAVRGALAPESRASQMGNAAIRQEFDALISNAQRNPEQRFRGELRPDVRPQPPQPQPPSGLQNAPLSTSQLQSVVNRFGRRAQATPPERPDVREAFNRSLRAGEVPGTPQYEARRTQARNLPAPPAPEQQIIHRYEPGPQTPGPDFTNIPRRPNPLVQVPGQRGSGQFIAGQRVPSQNLAPRTYPPTARQPITPSRATQPQTARTAPSAAPRTPYSWQTGLRDQEPARQFFDTHIRAQTGLNPEQFTKYYFADYVRNPHVRVAGNTMHIGGTVRAPRDMVARNAQGQEVRIAAGTYLGEIRRQITPGSREVYNEYFALSQEYQGLGVARQVFRNQIDVYRRMGGIDRVKVNAGLDGGGHTWARFGFVPTSESWIANRQQFLGRLRSIQNLTPARRAAVEALIRNDDPMSARALAALPMVKGGEGSGLGRKIMMNSGWRGYLDLRNPRDMNYFDGYVGPAAPQQ